MRKINQRFRSWSSSRLGDYDQCPHMAALKHLLKLCPKCFKGKVMGGFETVATCDTCGEVIKKGDALERGTAIGASLEHYIKGNVRAPHEEIRHPDVLELARDLRHEHKRKQVKVEFRLQFDRNWKLIEGEEWTPDVWLIVKLDVLRVETVKRVSVIDWKTGGIDKRTGEVRVDPKYPEQLEIYSTAVLSAIPEFTDANSKLVFVDCGPRFDPVVHAPEGTFNRKDLRQHQQNLTRRSLPMFRDEVFAPKPSPKCTWCDFSKKKGGPCPY